MRINGISALFSSEHIDCFQLSGKGTLQFTIRRLHTNLIYNSIPLIPCSSLCDRAGIFNRNEVH